MRLAQLSDPQATATELDGEAIRSKLTKAPGDNAIGGLKIVTAAGWFAARPSRTEDLYKLYAESFSSPDHLHRILEEAQAIIPSAFDKDGLSEGRR